MPSYIVLAKFTEQGARNIREMPQLIENNNKINAGQGIKVTRYFTMGDYDMVVLVDAPDEQSVMMGLLGVGSAGNIRTTTLRAFTEKEFLDTVKKLPAVGQSPAPKRAAAKRR